MKLPNQAEKEFSVEWDYFPADLWLINHITERRNEPQCSCVILPRAWILKTQWSSSRDTKEAGRENEASHLTEWWWWAWWWGTKWRLTNSRHMRCRVCWPQSTLGGVNLNKTARHTFTRYLISTRDNLERELATCSFSSQPTLTNITNQPTDCLGLIRSWV